eukprot:COSAG02_NODE_1836_length_10713_cov_5.352271_5_plen_110_part_00
MFHRNFPWAPVCVSISVETFPKASIPGTELDVPRLAAPRGPARGRARANLRDLTYRSSSTIAVCRIARARRTHAAASDRHAASGSTPDRRRAGPWRDSTHAPTVSDRHA